MHVVLHSNFQDVLNSRKKSIPKREDIVMFRIIAKIILLLYFHYFDVVNIFICL